MIQFIWLCPQRLTEGCGFSWDPLAAIPDFHLYTGKSQFRFLLLESLFPTPLHCQAESVNSASLGIRLGSCSAPNLCSHSRFVPSKSPQKALWYDENTPLTPSHCGKTDVANIPTLFSRAAFYPILFSGVAQKYNSFHKLRALCEGAPHPCQVTCDALDFETVIHSSVILRHSYYFH